MKIKTLLVVAATFVFLASATSIAEARINWQPIEKPPTTILVNQSQKTMIVFSPSYHATQRKITGKFFYLKGTFKLVERDRIIEGVFFSKSPAGPFPRPIFITLKPLEGRIIHLKFILYPQQGIAVENRKKKKIFWRMQDIKY